MLYIIFIKLIYMNSGVFESIVSLQKQITDNESGNLEPVAIGINAGKTSQERYTIAVGYNAGKTSQKESAIAIGADAGFNNQGISAIAIGANAGQTNQNSYTIAIGNGAGQTNQLTTSIAIGANAGKSGQNANAISLGYNSGSTNQATNSIAIGHEAGSGTQRQDSIAIGYRSGFNNQNEYSIAVGDNAGSTNQASNAIAIGRASGSNSQKSNCISIGRNSGNTNQGTNSIAIGYNCGYTGQGSNAIAIGYQAGVTDQYANSIIINATENDLDNTTQSGLFINPIRSAANTNNVLCYNLTNKEITYAEKTFVIDHPSDKNKYLVHACLEGPEAGIYYRGKGTITNNEYVEIELPEYVKYIGSNYSINITKIYSGKKTNENYETSEIEDNKFRVYGTNGSFYWLVFAERIKIDVEPNKNDVELKGDGPYTYLIKE